jgi:hypothetical protein
MLARDVERDFPLSREISSARSSKDEAVAKTPQEATSFDRSHGRDAPERLGRSI